MNWNISSKILTVLLFGFLFFQKYQAQIRTKINFGNDWFFTRDKSLDTGWERVQLPHSILLEDKVIAKQYVGKSYYKKEFSLDLKADEKAFLYFEGVMQTAIVFLNGEKIETHEGGYLPFTVELNEKLLLPNKNVLSIEVSNEYNPKIPPGKPIEMLDFNYFNGIYRNVYLLKTKRLYITDAVEANVVASGGINFQIANLSKEKAEGTIKVHLKNELQTAKNVAVKVEFSSDSKEKFVFTSKDLFLQNNLTTEISIPYQIQNPQLWNIDELKLYTLKVTVIDGDQILDEETIKVGFKKSELKADGFYLNDKKIYISGTNRHQEYPYVGNTISDEANYRDAYKIKEAGFNFVRLSHYPQAESFLNACDELGILVMNSIPGWQFFGDSVFQENSYQNLRDLVHRDRNHPSIIFWENSLNESEMSSDYMQKMNAILDEELPNSISTGWMDDTSYDLYIPARQHGKAPDYWTKYEKGNRKIFIAEYGDWEYYAQNAGFNQKEFSNLKEEERTSRQLRAFGEKRLLQQATNFQEASNSNRKGKNTIGEANWLQFDYTRGYSPDIESSGISDIFRIPKFAFYFYQSQRSPKQKKGNLFQGPMVKIASYWNELSPLNLTVFSNCDEIALYLNDSLIAKQKPLVNEISDQLSHPPFVFQLSKFEAGELKAIGYINNEKVASDIVRTAGKATNYKLHYDVSGKEINPTQTDVVFLYANVVDKKGTIVTEDSHKITFTISKGNAEIIGENPICSEAGIATVLLKTSSLNKRIVVECVSPILGRKKLVIKKK